MRAKDQVDITRFIIKGVETRERDKLLKIRAGLLDLVAAIDEEAHPTVAEITQAGWVKVKEVTDYLDAVKRGAA